MDAGEDLYENYSPSYKTQIRTTAFNSEEAVRHDLNYGDPISQRYVGATSQGREGNCRDQDENMASKKVPTTGSSQNQATSFTTRIMTVILFVAILLNTAMCIWLAISFQRAGLLSTEAPSLMKLELEQAWVAQLRTNISTDITSKLVAMMENLERTYHSTLMAMNRTFKSNGEAIAKVENYFEELRNTSLAISGASSNISNMYPALTTDLPRNYRNLLNAISATSTPSLSIRLLDGPNRYSGRVEIYYGGDWGTICDDNWDINDARVICRMLGYSGASSAPQQAKYGRGSGSILLDDVSCDGTESSIGHCSKSSWRTHNCGHGEDASVVCS